MAKNYTHKQIRKSLKEDALQVLIRRSLEFFRLHGENVIITVIIVGVIAVLVPLYFRHQTQNEQRAGTMLNRALSYEMQPLAAAGDFSGSEPFRTAEEKYKKVQQAYAEVVTTYGRTRAADQARLGEANALYYLKKYDQALAIYQEQAAKHSDPLLSPTLAARIGACLAGQNKWRETLENDRSLLQAYPDFFDRRAIRLRMARAYAHLNQPSEAEAILKDEIDQEPGSFWSETARQQMALLKK